MLWEGYYFNFIFLLAAVQQNMKKETIASIRSSVAPAYLLCWNMRQTDQMGAV